MASAEPPGTRAGDSPAPLFAALVALFLWGGTGVANKHAVNFMDAMSAGVLRSLLAGAAALAICLALRQPFPRENRHRALLLVSGITSFALWPALLSIGIAMTTAGHAGLIMAVLPVLTVLIATIASRKLPSSKWWAGALMALSGAAYLVFERVGVTDLLAAPDSLRGDLVIFAGCFLCAVGYVTGGKLSPVIGAVATTFWGLACALLLLIPLLWANFAATDWYAVPASGWAAILWMAALSSLTGYALWFYALGKGGIARMGSLQLLLPVISLLAAVAVLDEAVTPRLGVVCIVIVAGTWIAHGNAPEKS